MKNNEDHVSYAPERFIDSLIRQLGVRSYAALSRAVGLSPSVISKIRNRRLIISSKILVQVHEATDIPIRELRRMMGDTRRYFSPLKLSRFIAA